MALVGTWTYYESKKIKERKNLKERLEGVEEKERPGRKVKNKSETSDSKAHLIQISSRRSSEMSPQSGSFLQETSILHAKVCIMI